ncbi:MAG: hypothetical protein JXB35_03110, partial [Anaerolineae bacterium]|nr:hypothetical protein [Anaerolineae bacterium]
MVNHEDKRGTTALRDFARQNAVLLGVLAIVIMLAGGILGILSRAFVPPDDTATPESPTVTEPAVAEQIDDSLPTATPTAFPQEPEPVPSPTGIPEPTATPTPLPPFFEGPITYGTSFNGNPLLAYRLGYGPSARAIIGAIHGGYEWNTVNVVSDTLDYLRANPQLVPEQVT